MVSSDGNHLDVPMLTMSRSTSQTYTLWKYRSSPMYRVVEAFVLEMSGTA